MNLQALAIVFFGVRKTSPISSLLVAILFGYSWLASSAIADFELSFSPENTTIEIGQTVDIDLILSQSGTITPGADLVLDGITDATVELNLTSSAAIVTAVNLGTGLTDSFLTGIGPPPTISHLSFSGVTSPTGSITLGTFTFTGSEVGTTVVTTFDSDLQDFGFDGATDPGNIDASILGLESATITVVPEPSGFLLIAFIVCGARILRGPGQVVTETIRLMFGSTRS